MKRFLLASVLFFAALTAHAQFAEFTYQVSFPGSGDFGNFIDKTTWVGFSFQGRQQLSNEQWSVGGSISWFYMVDEKGQTTYTQGNESLTGYVTTFTNIFPLMAVAQYDFKDPYGTVVPFARIGVGGAWQDQRLDTGIFEFRGDDVQFALNGEIGVRINGSGGRNGGVIAATYHWLPGTDELLDTNFFGIKVGLSGLK